jgi:hypothetical protein
MLKAPLPEVPSENTAAQAQAIKTKNSAVRLACLMFVAAALLNLVIECTYIIGMVQTAGTPTSTESRRLVFGIGGLVLTVGLVWNLRHGAQWARTFGLVGCLIVGLKTGWELLYFINLKMNGYSEMELQIALMISLLGTLGAAVYYLMSSNARQFFAKADVS